MQYSLKVVQHWARTSALTAANGQKADFSAEKVSFQSPFFLLEFGLSTADCSTFWEIVNVGAA